MSKPAPAVTKPPNPLKKPFSLLVRVRNGNNSYSIVECTFAEPTSTLVLRPDATRLEADEAVKLSMAAFVGLNRLGPSEEDAPVLVVKR